VESETAGAETTGAAAGEFATGGDWCFRAKKKIAANAIIAAVEMRISVVEFDLVGGFDRDDLDVTLAAGTEISTAGTVAADGGGSWGTGGVVRTLPGGGTILGGTSLGVTLLGATLLGATRPVGTFSGEIGPGRTGLGGSGLGGAWLVGT
jgi:hypothetical protein